MNRAKLIRQRNIGIAAIIGGILLALWGFDTKTDADRKLLLLDQQKLDQAVLE